MTEIHEAIDHPDEILIHEEADQSGELIPDDLGVADDDIDIDVADESEPPE